MVDSSTKGKSRPVYHMAMANYSGQTVTATKASSDTGSATEKAKGKTRTVAHMLANTKRISHQAKDCTSGKMARAMRANGRMGCSMEKASRSFPMEQSSMGIGTWAYRKDWECASIQMEVSTMVIGSMDSHMVSERRPYLMAPPMKEDGSKGRLEAMASRFSRMGLYLKVSGRSQSSSKGSVSSQTDRSLTVNG